MGIKGLNGWIAHNEQIKHIQDISSIIVDTLFIDGQQILYPVLSKFANQEEQNESNALFLKQCEIVINTFHPSENIFFAMDGPNPAAKFQTQRKKRFQELIDKMKTNNEFQYPNEEICREEYEKIKNDAAESIDNVLKNYLQNLSQNEKCITKRILYSGRRAAGEAEHKYLDFFRKQKNSPEWKPNQNHFIFSNDNDLMFLSLQFTDENFYVIKFNFDEQNNLTYNIIDISSIREYFLSQIYNRVNESTPQFKARIIKDIIGLSFILGNDFIPDFEDVEQRCGSFIQFIKAYSMINMDCKNNYKYLIINDTFNVFTFQQIVSKYFDIQKRNRYQNRNKQYKQNQPQNKKIQSQDEKQKKAQELLRIFNFTYLYYTQEVPSWSYYYPYKDSINLQESVKLMKQEGKEFFDSLEDKEKTTPFLKALITHSSAETFGLPWDVFKIKVSGFSPIADKYWPHIIDANLVPMFDLNEIKIQYKKAIENLSKEELEFNKIDDPYYEYKK